MDFTSVEKKVNEVEAERERDGEMLSAFTIANFVLTLKK